MSMGSINVTECVFLNPDQHPLLFTLRPSRFPCFCRADMEQHLIEEISGFIAHRRRLRRLFKETVTCLTEIDAIVKSPGIRILSDEEEQLRGWLLAPAGLCIVSPEPWMRALIINTILHKNVLPVCERTDHRPWHTLKITYGKMTSGSLVLTASGSNEEFVVTGSSLCSSREPTVVSLEDLLKDSQTSMSQKRGAPTDTAIEDSIFNIKVQDSVLSCEGTEIIAPDLTDFTNKRLTPREIVDKYCGGVCVTIVYGIADSHLSATDIAFLKDLNADSCNIDIFFVSVTHTTDEYKTQAPDSLSVDRQPLPDLVQISERQQLRTNLLQFLSDFGFDPVEVEQIPGGRSADIGDIVSDIKDLNRLPKFVGKRLGAHLMKVAKMLHVIHKRVLTFVINVSFELKRDLMVTPTKIDFVKREESALYKDLLQKTKIKEKDVTQAVKDVQSEVTAIIPDLVDGFIFDSVEISDDGRVSSMADLKKCTEQIHELVLGTLNERLVARLTELLSGLKELYTGVLVRCLEKLEQGQGDSPATAALHEMLRVAYTVEVSAPSHETVLQLVLSRLQQCLIALHLSRSVVVDAQWRRGIAQTLVHSLSQDSLARSVCGQLRLRLDCAHRRFENRIKQLEQQHSTRLQGMQKSWLDIRKTHAPRLSRLLLFSTSAKHVLAWGMPQHFKELGRGQYGIVYNLERWGPHENCAVKSLVPPDEKHLQDMAMEFYYTEGLPPHPHIVPILGSAIDYSYGEGKAGCPAVLLVMPRYRRDLYVALNQGLSMTTRLQIASDVVSALRFLHQQGLVHRDVKLKNVLISNNNRGKLTDLGFCKANAMMSGSIVGTPIHMAPELFDGHYDNSVDTYAFGIMLWYLVAGQSQLPQRFAECSTKEELWGRVRNGRRPERLDRFDEVCWKLMSSCWSADLRERPLLGQVQETLEERRCHYQEQAVPGVTEALPPALRHISSDSEF